MGLQDKNGWNSVVTRNEARSVAKGNSQEEVIDYDGTFSPITRLETIRMFHSLATHSNFKINQMDAKSSFLNGELEEEVYVEHHNSLIYKNISLIITNIYIIYYSYFYYVSLSLYLSLHTHTHRYIYIYI